MARTGGWVMRYLGLMCLVLLGACEPKGRFVRDNDVQAKVFAACMAALPAGPERTHYNDWAEVVEECNDAARDIATRWEDPR